MKRLSHSEEEKFLAEVKKYALKGDYKSALKITEKYLKNYSEEFICQYQYAKILGDYADELPVVKRRPLKQKAIRLLKPLLQRLSGKSEQIRFGICLNYYYQSEDFQGMYRFGKRLLNSQNRVYAMGLAGALLAQNYYNLKKTSLAQTWAAKSVKAWQKYPLKAEKYYFAHYSYAKALAIVGDRKTAMTVLKTAARLGKRPVSDWEFSDVLEIMEA